MKQDPVSEELSPNAQDLYIFFGGISSGIAMPPFEFYKASQIIDENKIFVRDLRQRWYQAGLPGVSNSIQGTAEFLRQRIQCISPRKTYFVGNSMGGFAAILFSSLLNEGMAIAFAPQTFISRVLRRKYGDKRWARQIARTHLSTIFKKTYFDLKTTIGESTEEPKTQIFVSSADKLDMVHAEYLSDLPSVKVFQLQSGGHQVVKLLRDEGRLPKILRGEFEKVA